jgi:hypothetical protein
MTINWVELILGACSVWCFGVAAGLVLGQARERNIWRHHLIRRGHGGFDWDTGVWRWKIPIEEVTHKNKHDEG